MRKSAIFATSIATALVSGVAAILPAQQSFEGTITYQKTVTGEGPAEVRVWVKGTKLRMQIDQSIIVTDAATDSMFTLMPWIGQFISRREMLMMRKADTTTANKTLPDEEFTVTKAGQSDTIAGVACDNYSITVKSPNAAHAAHSSKTCIATGQGNVPIGGGDISKPSAYFPSDKAMLKQFPNGFFPLKLTTFLKGTQQMEMVVTKIDRLPVDATLFTLSPRYKEIDETLLK